MRLIDANELLTDLKESAKDAREWRDETQDEEIKIRAEQSFGTFVECALRVKHAPTIEAEPVRHGRWMNTDETVWNATEIDGKQHIELIIVAARCSSCELWSEQVNNFSHYKFCPHCGSRMDGGDENVLDQ